MNMRLVDARLCADCDTIYDENQVDFCPKCTSTEFLRLAPILGKVA